MEDDTPCRGVTLILRYLTAEHLNGGLVVPYTVYAGHKQFHLWL